MSGRTKPDQGTYIRQLGEHPLIHTVVASSPTAELYLMWGKDSGEDAHYLLVTGEGTVAKFGITGLVQAVYRTAGKALEPVIKRNNAYGNFQFNPIHTGTIEDAIDPVYHEIAGMEFEDRKARDLFAWRAQRVIARFGDYSSLYSKGDIVPEYSDAMTIVKLAEGCPRACIYCPEPGKGIRLYSKPEIKNNMRIAKSLQRKYHAGFEAEMDEGFLNASDILWFKLRNETDPVEITAMFKDFFPEVAKLYAFTGVPTVNKKIGRAHV
jgi:hypothetical protein